jgi:nucleotide-binding universal stress UspA family protein
VLIFFEGLVIWLAIVLVSMLIVAFLARRWGHDPFGWLFFAAAMGPIAIVALVGTRHREQDLARKAPAHAARADAPVLVACDGSPATAEVARYVAASYHGAPVVLLTVEAHEAEPRSDAEREEQSVRIARMTAPAATVLRDAGIAFEAAVAYGRPGEQIVRYATTNGARAIVVGRRGAGLSRALLGSVSDYVVKNAHQPVLVVG